MDKATGRKMIKPKRLLADDLMLIRPLTKRGFIWYKIKLFLRNPFMFKKRRWKITYVEGSERNGYVNTSIRHHYPNLKELKLKVKDDIDESKKY